MRVKRTDFSTKPQFQRMFRTCVFSPNSLAYYLFIFCVTSYVHAMRPISLHKPVLANVTHPLPRSELWGPFVSYEGGLPTNAFWTNLVLDEGIGNIAVYPYIVAVSTKPSRGLRLAYPQQIDGASAVMDAIDDELVLGASAEATSRYVAAFDDLCVTLQVNYGSTAADDAYISYPLVRGSPFVSAKYNHVAPRIESAFAILDVQDCKAGETCDTDTLRITLANQQVWLVFMERVVSIQWTSDGIDVKEPYTGWLRAAVATSPAAEAVLPIYKRSIPLGGTVSYKASDDVVSIVFSWRVEGDEALLMTSLPHHRDSITGVSYEEAVVFNTLRGDMIGTVGETWVLLERPTTVTWSAPRPIASDKVNEVHAALAADKDFDPGAGSDPYFGGKALAKLARLILIAEELREDGWVEEMTSRLKDSMDPWICGKNSDPLRYDDSYGGVVSTNGVNDPYADFGNGWYNDHHFHYGYFFYAAAVVARMDKGWLEQPARGCSYARSMFFKDLIRDVANPAAEDTAYPTFRYMDWFEGHSWASGLAGFNDGKNQESTSEAVNGWYGLYLLGISMADTNIRDLGLALLTSELHSAKRYWHIHSGNSVYGNLPSFSANKVVGILWGTKADYTTWFGASAEFIHCIQMMPFTPVTEDLLEETWVQEEYPVLRDNLSADIGQGWLGFVYMDHAVIDKEKAWNEVATLTEFDDGNSKANTLYWVATRP